MSADHELDQLLGVAQSAKAAASATPYVGNMQAFANRPSTGLAVGDEFSFHEGLEGREPNLTIINEKPEHIMMVMLRAKGVSQREIALRMQMSEAWVSQVCRQPWFRDRLFQFMKEAGVDIVTETLKMEVLPSIHKLIDIRDNQTAGARAQSAAAMYLLDRVMGKATQRVESYDAGKAPSLEASEQLDAEIQRAADEVKRLEGSKGQ